MKTKISMALPQGPYGTKKFYGKELERYLKKETEWEAHNGKPEIFSIDLEPYQQEGRRLIYLWSSPSSLGTKLKELKNDDLILVRDEATKDFLKKHMQLDSQVLSLFGIRATKYKKWNKRRIPVFFPGSYLDEASTLKHMKEVYPIVMCEIAFGSITWMEKEKNYEIETGIRSFLSQEGIDYSDHMIYSYIEEYGFGIEDYFRRKLRNQVIDLLIKKQVPLHVCGVNWNIFYQKLSPQDQNYLIVHESNLSPRAVADFMADSKIVLNLSANVIQGIHERVTMAMMNGAICVTDKNDYIQKELAKENVVEFFSWESYKYLPKKIHKLLKNEKEGMDQSERARVFAESQYSISAYWNQVCEGEKGEE